MLRGHRTDLEPSANWREVANTPETRETDDALIPQTSIAAAAEKLGAGVRSTERARYVIRRGTPEERSQVE